MVAVGHVLILILVIEVGLKKLTGLLVVLNVIAWTDDTCRARVSEKD